MRILSLVLAFADEGWTRRCLDRINTDLIVIDNNAHQPVKEVIADKKRIVNPENIYVNPAWNQGMIYFLNGDWTHLAIINSDLELDKHWADFIKSVWSESIIPCVNTGNYITEKFLEAESVAGVFVFLSRAQVEKVFPIPHTLKLWFGENYIFNKLGLKKYIYRDLKALHGNSRSVSVLPEAIELIEEDKKAWEQISLKHGWHKSILASV